MSSPLAFRPRTQQPPAEGSGEGDRDRREDRPPGSHHGLLSWPRHRCSRERTALAPAPPAPTPAPTPALHCPPLLSLRSRSALPSPPLGGKPRGGQGRVLAAWSIFGARTVSSCGGRHLSLAATAVEHTQGGEAESRTALDGGGAGHVGCPGLQPGLSDRILVVPVDRHLRVAALDRQERDDAGVVPGVRGHGVDGAVAVVDLGQTAAGYSLQLQRGLPIGIAAVELWLTSAVVLGLIGVVTDAVVVWVVMSAQTSSG